MIETAIAILAVCGILAALFFSSFASRAANTVAPYKTFARSKQASEIQQDQVRIAGMKAKLSAIGLVFLLLLLIAKIPLRRKNWSPAIHRSALQN